MDRIAEAYHILYSQSISTNRECYSIYSNGAKIRYEYDAFGRTTAIYIS